MRLILLQELNNTQWTKWLLDEESTKSIDDQCEYFLFKFNAASGDDDVTRAQVLELKGEYAKFDDKNKGELEIDQAMRLLESRHETKTYTELRELLNDIDQNNNNKLSLLEWLCAFFNKSWEKLMEPDADVDVEAIKAELMAEAKKKEEDALKAQQEYVPCPPPPPSTSLPFIRSITFFTRRFPRDASE